MPPGADPPGDCFQPSGSITPKTGNDPGCPEPSHDYAVPSGGSGKVANGFCPNPAGFSAAFVATRTGAGAAAGAPDFCAAN